jgi:hypothetical protein
MNASTRHERTAGSHFRLLFTLVHALSQSGATVIDIETHQPLDPNGAILVPQSGPPHLYQVTLSPKDGELITQIYLLQTLLVADAQVQVRYRDHEGEHDEEIVKIGWSDPAQLTSTPFSVMPKDFRGFIRLFPQGCTFLVKI